MKSKLLLWLLLLCSGSAWAQQNLSIQESFEAPSGDYGYTSNTFIRNTVNPSTEYFIRAQNTVPGFGNPAGSANMSGVHGTYFWACEGVRSRTSNTVPDAGSVPGIVTLNAIPNTQNYTNLKVIVAAGDPRSSTNIARETDHLRVQYAYGDPNGTYTTLFEFTGTTVGGTSSWTRVTRSGTNVTGTAAILTSTFSNHESTIPAGSGALYIRVEADYQGANKELAFDNIRVTGTASTVVKPTITSNVGTSTLTFAEGTTTPLTVFSDLTVGNPAMTSNPTLTGATVSLIPYAGVQDELTYTIPSGSGITLASNSNGVLTFSGSSSVGNYEALLQTVKYKNTEVNNATAGDRNLTFVVRDGTTESIPLSRTITVTTALDAASAPPRLETFDTDGEGTRYGSNTRTLTISGITRGFMRLTNASGGSASPGSAFSTSTTFTNVQGTGYWFVNGTKGAYVPGNVGIVQLAPVNSTGFVNLRFKIRAGAGNTFGTDDFLRFSYNLNDGTGWQVFANYIGGPTNGLRLDGNAANPALTTALTALDFALPASVTGTNIDFRVESANDGGEEIVFDEIQVTGTQQTTVNSIVRASTNPTNAATVNYTVTFGAAVTGLTASNFTLTSTGISGASVGTPIQGTGNTWTVPVSTGSGNGSLTLNLANDTGLSYDITTTLPFAGETYTIDKTAPFVPAVTAPANGSVINTTTPTYTGTAEANSTVTVYVDGSGSGNVIGTTAATAGGTFSLVQPTTLAQGSHTVFVTSRDAAGNTSAASSTISFTVDTTAPSVTITSSAGSSGSTTGTTPIPFTVTFSESVGTSFVQTDVTVTNGTIVTGSFSGSGAGPYTFTVTPSGSGSTVTVAVAANQAQDAAGNGNTTSTPNPFSITYQQPLVATSRSVTVQLDANGNGTLQANSGTSGVNNGSTGPGTLIYTIQKIVYGRIPERAAPLTLTTPNGANFTSIRFASYGTPIDNGNGNYSQGPCNAANSLAAAQNAYVGRSSGDMYASNTDARNSPILGDPCGGTPKALAVQAAYSADAASLTYNCTEAGQTQYVLLTVTNGTSTSTSVAQVTVNPSPTISISSLSPNPAQRGATITVSGSNLSGIGSTVTVNGASATVSGLSASGFTFVVPNTATIGAGNLTLTAPCSQTLNTAFTVQQPATAAPVLNQPANAANGQPTFSGTAPANSAIVITVLQGSTTVRTFTGITADGSGNYTYTVLQAQALPIGTYTVTATAQTSGSSVSAASNQRTFVVPTAGPTTAITSTAPNPTTVAPIPVTVTFSRVVSGFDASDVTATNSGGGTTTVSTPTSGDGKVYTFDVTPSATGLVTVSVPAGAAQDSLSRTNQAATALTRQYNQPTTAAPAITSPLNNSFTNTSVTFVGTAPANSQVVFYISQNGGAFQPSPSFLVSATGNFSVGPFAFSDGVYQVYATAQSPNSSVSPNSPTITITVDTTRPSVVITSSAGASGGSTATTPIPFSVTFSETVNGSFVQGDLSVSGGTIVTGSFSGSGAGPYTFTVTPNSLGSTVSVNVQANVAQDAASNFNTAAPAAYTLRYAPALSATVSTTSGSPTSTSPIPFRVDFSQSVGSTFVASDVTVSGGTVNAASFSGSGAGPYTFTVTPGGTGTVTVSLAANVAQDAATTGNTASNSVSVQFQAPTIVVAPASLPGGTQGVAYSATFSTSGGSGTYTYALTGTPIPGLTLTGATLSGTPTASGSYTFTITATDNSAAPGPYSGFRNYSVTIAAPVVTSVAWTGNNSTDWFNASNWSPSQVPDATIDAIVPTSPSGGRFPVITANAAQANARNVSIASGAALSMSANTLIIEANLTNNGAFNGFTGSGGSATGGTVVLGSSAVATIGGTGTARFWNLTVGSNGTQSTLTGNASVQRVLTLNGNLTAGQSFTLVSDANGTAMVVNNGSAVASGTVTVQRYIDPNLNPNLGYRHVSAAVGNATVSSLATSSFSPVVNPAYNASATPLLTVPFPTVYGYEQARLATTTNNLNAFDKGWYSPNATSDPLAVGQGYTVLIGGGQTWNFAGPLNNGNVTVNLARNSGATAADAGYALIGNPYPSPLDWGQVQDADRPNVGRTMYVYRSNNPGNPYSGSYGFYNNGIGTISPVIAQGQGFFVRVADTQTTGSVTFKNSHRPTTYSSPTYQRTTETRPLVELNLQGAGSALTDAAFVYFEQGATDAFDTQYDAEKLANPSGLNLSTSLSATQRLAIDGRAPLGTAQRVVPLAVGVPAVGSYTLTAAQVLNLGTTPVYLRDLQTGAVVDLRAQPSYSFTVSNASALLTSRFELVFSPQAPLATAPAALAAQVGLYPNPATTTAFVELPAVLGRTAVAAELVDALGRTVRTLSLPAQGAAAHRLDLANLATGMYTLHLKTSAGVVVKKLVVE